MVIFNAEVGAPASYVVACGTVYLTGVGLALRWLALVTIGYSGLCLETAEGTDATGDVPLMSVFGLIGMLTYSRGSAFKRAGEHIQNGLHSP